MAVIAPNSEIYLIKCPIELDNLNQLSFANATAQHNYFNSLPKLSLTNATFQRKDGTIRWPGSMEDVLEYNYCMYRNKSHGNKWFYAFVDNMVYITDNMTAITITTDVWNTWQFDISWHPSYVEREHVTDDTIGLHTIPEGLDTGEYVCNEVQKEFFARREYYSPADPTQTGRTILCVQLTTLTITKDGNTYQPSNPPTYQIVNGVPNGLYTIGIPYTKNAMAAVYKLVGAYDSAGKADAIVSMFLCPCDVTSWTQMGGTGIWAEGTYFKPDEKDTAYTSQLISVTNLTTIDGYTPKNNKCFVGPYNYIHVSNNNGTDIEFYYEDFIGNLPSFTIEGSLEQGGAVMLIPSGSKKSSGNVAGGNTWTSQGFPEGVIAGKMPQVSWLSDYYLNWEAMNGKNITIQTGLAAAGWATNVIGGMLSGATAHHSSYEMGNLQIAQAQKNPRAQEKAIESVQTMHGSNESGAMGMIGSVFDFASSIASTQNAIRQAKMVPPQAKGASASGTLPFASNNCAFTIYKMSCRAEYIKCIDDYFSMFGYKVNTLKLPNISGRPNWNYVKTVGCNITGDIPQGDLQAIKAMFNSGVTIWHNPSTFLDYSQNNNIV